MDWEVSRPKFLNRAKLHQVRDERPAVAVGIPMTETLKRTAVNQFLHLFKYLRDDDVFLPVAETAVVSVARNRIIEQFLALPDSVEFLFLFDDDMVINTHTIELMVWRNQPFLSGLAVRKSPPFSPTATLVSGSRPSESVMEMSYGDTVEKHHVITGWEPRTNVYEAHGVGAACLCLRRDLLKAIEPPWFKFGESAGEDLYFCRKVREAGFHVLVDTHVLPGHVGEHVATYNDWVANRDMAAANDPSIPASDIVGKDAA